MRYEADLFRASKEKRSSFVACSPDIPRVPRISAAPRLARYWSGPCPG